MTAQDPGDRAGRDPDPWGEDVLTGTELGTGGQDRGLHLGVGLGGHRVRS